MGVKTLCLAMECNYTPFNWTQTTADNGAVRISGSTDYANGYKLEIVKLDWESLIPALQSGTVDCTIAGQSITSDRLQMVEFSLPYYYASIITLTKGDSKYADAEGESDLSGAVCTNQTGGSRRKDFPRGFSLPWRRPGHGSSSSASTRQNESRAS